MSVITISVGFAQILPQDYLLYESLVRFLRIQWTPDIDRRDFHDDSFFQQSIDFLRELEKDDSESFLKLSAIRFQFLL